MLAAVAYLLIAAGAVGAARAETSPPRVACDRLSWQQCAQVVGRLLEQPAARSDLRVSVTLAAAWNAKFRSAYLAMNKEARSESDIDKLEGAVADELNPIVKARDTLVDALIKQYLPRLATILAFVNSASMQGLFAWLTSSEVATDLDQLIQANDAIQRTIAERLAPHLASDWKNQFQTYVRRSFDRVGGPAIEGPAPVGGSHQADPLLCGRLGTCR